MPDRQPSYASCSGCSLCLLACPVWRQRRDIRLTPQGRTKALQHGAQPAELAASIAQCTLCGACEPVCPEGIPLVDLMLELRRAVPLGTTTLRDEPGATQTVEATTVLIASAALPAAQREHAARALGAVLAADDGADIALALESGTVVPETRRKRFVASLPGAQKIIVADGLLLRALGAWLPGARVVSLGEALSALASRQGQLRADDLYVIEPRGFHARHAALVAHYDRLRQQTGCSINLDLQRLALPTTAAIAQRTLGREAIDASEETRWIAEGRRFSRVVVEDAADAPLFAAVTGCPAIHVAELVQA